MGSLNAAAYARYSTDHQTSNSIVYQLEKIKEYARNNKLDIISIYKDEGQTGTNQKRDGFQALLAAANRKEFDAVIVYDMTRGSRDVADWFNFRKDMMYLGIKVISATENLGDLANPSDFLTELIGIGLGQHAVLGTRQKSIDGVAVKAKEGKFLGGTPPLGYDIKDGNYLINEKEAQTVKTIFLLYAQGKSYNHIIDSLQGSVGKFGRPLGKNSIYSILKNERYIGTYTWNKRKMRLFRRWIGGKPNPDCIKIDNAIPPIIDMETWERVQARMKDNKKNATNKAKRVYLLSGLIECEKCGSTYVAHTTINRGKEYTSYVCGNKYRTHTCGAKNINANEIETFVVAHLSNYLKSSNIDDLAGIISQKMNQYSVDTTAEKREIIEIEKQIENILTAISNGAFMPELNDKMDNLRNRKEELSSIIKESATRKSPVTDNEIKDILLLGLENADQITPELVKRYVPKIIAHADGSFSVHMGLHMDNAGGGT